MEFPAIWGLVRRLRTFPEADFWNFWGGVERIFVGGVKKKWCFSDPNHFPTNLTSETHPSLETLTWLHRCKLSDSLVSVSKSNNEDPIKSKLAHIPKYQNGTETYQPFHTPTKTDPTTSCFCWFVHRFTLPITRLSSSEKTCRLQHPQRPFSSLMRWKRKI